MACYAVHAWEVCVPMHACRPAAGAERSGSVPRTSVLRGSSPVQGRRHWFRPAAQRAPQPKPCSQ